MPHWAAEGFEGISHSGNGSESNNSTFYDNSYGIGLAASPGTGSSDYLTSRTGIGSYTSFYFGFSYFVSSTSSQTGRVLTQYQNSGGTSIFRLSMTGSLTAQAQYWNGSAWTNLGGTFTLPNATVFRLDLKLLIAVSGAFVVYINGVEQTGSTVTGVDLSSLSNVDEWRQYSTASAGAGNFSSEFIWGDEPTLNHRCAIKRPNADGTYTAGSGGFADVNEDVTNDGTITTLASAADAETYTHAAMTLPTGTVKAVIVGGRVSVAAGGASSLKARLRIGSTNYDQASAFADIDAAYRPYRARWTTNPAGGSWTQTTAKDTANEFGYVAT